VAHDTGAPVPELADEFEDELLPEFDDFPFAGGVDACLTTNWVGAALAELGLSTIASEPPRIAAPIVKIMMIVRVRIFFSPTFPCLFPIVLICTKSLLSWGIQVRYFVRVSPWKGTQ